MRVRIVVAWVMLALVPAVVSGQQTNTGTITGVVRDATGGVLPGVTVEAASPALIERVRVFVTDGTGQYRIIDLPPGVYDVTFTLPGFGTLVREDIPISAGFTATIPGELSVGEITETITVTGAPPVVDLQNTTHRAVLSREVLDAIPQGRSYGAIGKLIVGLENVGSAGGHDVGGTSGRDTNKLVAHGGATDDFKLKINGFPQNTFTSGGGDNIGVPQPDSLAEEFTLQYSALPAEVETGGVAFNIIPKTGGNEVRGSFFGNYADSSMQSKNASAEQVKRGLDPDAGGIDYVSDWNVSIGGPIRQDKAWYFITYRDLRPMQFSLMHYDTVKDDMFYVRDKSKQLAFEAKPQRTLHGRLNWQATPRNRFNFAIEGAKIDQQNFFIGAKGTRLKSPAATALATITHRPIASGSWTGALTNRLMVEAGMQNFRGRWNNTPQMDISVAPGAIELTSGIQFRSPLELSIIGYQDAPWRHQFMRGSVSYTTGSHALKVGSTVWVGRQQWFSSSYGFGSYSWRLINGVPNGVEYRVDPLFMEIDLLKTAFYAQDQWTINRLTTNIGVRIDTVDTKYPDMPQSAGDYLPARTFTGADVIRWRDISPRLGFAYDLFGNGRTALKATASRYVQSETTRNTRPVNPAIASSAGQRRTWDDANGDLIAQGDPLNHLPNGEIGRGIQDWGTTKFRTRPDTAWSDGGWGVRPYNWEFSGGLQQEIASNMSLSVMYFRRQEGNFIVTDNLMNGPNDFDSYCIPTPTDSRLEGGGGGQTCGLFDVTVEKYGQTDNFITMASNYGDVIQTYNGVDTSVNFNLPRGLLQGGFSIGKQLYDFCDIVDELPEMLVIQGNTSPRAHCRQQQPNMTQVKVLGAIDLFYEIQFAATYQDSYNWAFGRANYVQGQPRMGQKALFLVKSESIKPTLGRDLSKGAKGTIRTNLQHPGTLFGDRLRQLDVRLARTFTGGRTSTKVMVDLYNALDTNTNTNYNSNYGLTGATWQDPLAKMPGRLIKVGVQFDF